MYQAPSGGLRKAPPPPKWLQEKPELDRELYWYWDSFRQLDTERKVDGGEIPWSSILKFCDRWGLKSDFEFDSFLYFIRQMDNIYLEEQEKKLNRKRLRK